MECQLQNIAIHYELFGEGMPIIMLHGWSLSHRHMMATMEPLFTQRDGWKRIYPDLPGHGLTPGKDWITDQDKMLDVVLAFIDEIIPEQRLVVAGASAGAYLARGVAYRRPTWLDGLLLTVPLIVAPDAKRTVPSHKSIVANPGLIAELRPAEAETMRNLAVVESQKIVDGLRASCLDVGGDPDFQSKIRDDPEKYAFSFDVDAISEPFGAPTLIVAGRQDSNVGYRQAWEILETYPRATFVVLDRAGHLLELEQEQVLAALVREWLDRVEEYAAAAK
jgi:pimeloyl-ACP methyl ester carboxylesterase